MAALAFLVLAAQVGGNVSNTVPSQGGRLTLCSGVRVTASDRAAPPRDMTFSSRQTLDLLLRPRFRRGMPGDHLMQLKVFTPGGYLYQVITVPFNGAPSGGGEPSAAPPTRVVPGYPRPLEVQQLVPVRSSTTTRAEYELRARLPVAGTSITLSSIYGTWSVQAFLDGRAEPCGPATRFTIRD